MCDQQSLKSACAYAQSDQSLCKSLVVFYDCKATDFTPFEVSKPKKEAAHAHLSLHLSKCQIAGNLMPRLLLTIVLHRLSDLMEVLCRG